MGVPAFFRWLCSRNPNIIINANEYIGKDLNNEPYEDNDSENEDNLCNDNNKNNN